MQGLCAEKQYTIEYVRLIMNSLTTRTSALCTQPSRFGQAGVLAEYIRDQSSHWLHHQIRIIDRLVPGIVLTKSRPQAIST